MKACFTYKKVKCVSKAAWRHYRIFLTKLTPIAPSTGLKLVAPKINNNTTIGIHEINLFESNHNHTCGQRTDFTDSSTCVTSQTASPPVAQNT